MKLPGPDHPITITGNPKRVRALFEGHLLADTGESLTLKEASYKAVEYLPREDVAMAYLTRTDRRTTCPYKGVASYYTIFRDGAVAENAAWSYEDPYPAMALIKGRIAFYPHPVEIHELDDGEPPIAEIIEYTDSGAGQSQREHWAANVSEPLEEPVEAKRPFKDTGSI